LAFLASVRLVFGCGAPGSGVAVFSVSIVFVLVVFLLDRVAVVTIHRSGPEKQQGNSSEIVLRLCQIAANWRLGAFFMYPTKSTNKAQSERRTADEANERTLTESDDPA
jgi:hypothetical protein